MHHELVLRELTNGWVAIGVATLALASLVLASGSAAAPGNPGVPSPPAVVFTEGFENVANPALGQPLAGYTGPAPTSMTYTAHPDWLSGPACNGIIGSFNSTTGSTGCSASVYNNYIRAIARGMGAVLGGGNDNQVMGDVTVSGFPAAPTPAATLQTVSPIPLPSGSRFITFSVDVGVVSCNAGHPRLRFFLLDGATTVPVTNAAIDPCTAPGGTTVAGVRVGSYATDRALLLSGGAVGFKLTNDQTSGSGNDYAIDNVRILDATPQLDKEFVDDVAGIGSPTQLRFTVTNTSDLAEKAGWSFTDDLPPGMRIADPANATTNCDNGVVDAVAGGSSIAVTGDLGTGDTACTITLDVTADGAGTYSNGPGNISQIDGLNPPGTDSVEFAPADLSIVKSADHTKASPGEPVTYTFDVHNAGPAVAHDVTVRDPLSPYLQYVSGPPGCAFANGEVVCDFGDLDPGESASQSIVLRLDPAYSPASPPTAHDIDVQRVEASLSLQPGETRQASLSCPAGFVMSDGGPRVDSVDQGNDPADVHFTASHTTPDNTAAGIAGYTFEIENDTAGQAQVHLFGVCVALTSTAGSAGAHTLGTPALATGTIDAADLPGPQRLTRTLTCANPNDVAIAPGYALTGIPGTLVESEASADGRSWTFAFEAQPGAGGDDFHADLSIRCLPRATSAAGGHSHALVFHHVFEDVTVPANSTGEYRVSCPVGFKGISETHSLPSGLLLLGTTPQPINRDFRLTNTTGAALSATIDLVCLESRIGDQRNGGSVMNTASVYGNEPDLDASDDFSSWVLDDPPAGGGPVGDPGPGPDDVPGEGVPTGASEDGAAAGVTPNRALRRCLKRARALDGAADRRRAIKRCHRHFG